MPRENKSKLTIWLVGVGAFVLISIIVTIFEGSEDSKPRSEKYQGGYQLGVYEGAIGRRTGAPHLSQDELDAGIQNVTRSIIFKDEKEREDYADGYKAGYEHGFNSNDNP